MMASFAFICTENSKPSCPPTNWYWAEGAPQYDRDFKAPAYLDKIKSFDPASIEVPDNLKEVAEKIVSIPNIASKWWVAVQYDSTVGIANASYQPAQRCRNHPGKRYWQSIRNNHRLQTVVMCLPIQIREQ